METSITICARRSIVEGFSLETPPKMFYNDCIYYIKTYQQFQMAQGSCVTNT